MARQTRSQRRARREAQARSGGGDGAALERGRTRQQPQPARPTAQPSTAPASAPRGGGFIRFVQESIGELKKVEWPNQQQLIQGTVVVLIACIVVGTYLWGVDLVFKRLVENVFLGK
ncbi:MAG: preprotein translocase subunit SecE [Actinomycetota bacterium]|nr:preprotein translocase subunit SecE [Actinomycetota bacterium]